MASKKFYVDLQLNKNSIKSAVLENVAVSGVSAPATGQIAFDTTSSKLSFYNGSSWEAVGQLAVDTVNYKGSLGTDAMPAGANAGDLYVVGSSESATMASAALAKTIEIGDFVIHNGAGWDVIQGNLSISNASTSVAGLISIATDEETITGTNSTKAVVPSALKAFADIENKTITRKRVYAAQTISTTPLVLTHNIGRSDVHVSVYSSGELIEVEVVKGSGTVTLTANSSIAGAEVVISA